MIHSKRKESATNCAERREFFKSLKDSTDTQRK